MSNFPGTPVIILGMGRSGTSYLASFLGANGVSLGDEMLEPSTINPRGYYEDKEILEFHRSIRRRLDTTAEWDSQLSELLPEPQLTPEEMERAVRILKRLAKQGLWGWKEPRTVRFIRFWLSLLPNAKVIVPLRHPLEIFYSYLKRIATVTDLIDINRFFRAYTQCHERILEIVKERPAQSLILNTQQAFADPAALWAKVNHFLEIEGDPRRFTIPVFAPSEFTRLAITRESSEIFEILLPDAAATFNRLNDCSALSAVPGPCPVEQRPVFLRLVECIRGAGEHIAHESWLPVLMDLCASGESEGYFVCQGRIMANASARLLELAGWIAELEKARNFWDHQAATLKEQAAWIAELEQARQFWERQEATMKEQAERIAELEQVKRHWGLAIRS
jgi:hypothetical protein